MNASMYVHPTRLLGFFVAVFSLLASLTAPPASAAASPVGTWSIGGNLIVSAKFPGVILSTTALNAKTLGMTITYKEGGTFESTLMGLNGTWTQAGNKVDLNLDAWIDGIQKSVGSLLPEGTVVSVSKRSFTTKIVSARKMNGKVKVIIAASIPAGAELGGVALAKAVSGRISISGALTNTPAPAALSANMLGLDALTGETLPVDVLNRVIGGVFWYQLMTR
ncbi:MAG: hypothetical protein H6R26_324 [Proteobacteria bacterium]|nr:hypothetical protein [Pseudomonadota bacterium]